MLNNPSIGGKNLPTLTTPGTAADLANGKQLIGQDGTIINGTFRQKCDLQFFRIDGESAAYYRLSFYKNTINWTVSLSGTNYAPFFYTATGIYYPYFTTGNPVAQLGINQTEHKVVVTGKSVGTADLNFFLQSDDPNWSDSDVVIFHITVTN